jgi:valyl-tRNA synthetase
MTETKREIPKAYDPSKTEDRWYKYWLDNELFHSEPDGKPPFTIAIPPPIVLQAVITV